MQGHETVRLSERCVGFPFPILAVRFSSRPRPHRCSLHLHPFGVLLVRDAQGALVLGSRTCVVLAGSH